MLGRARRAVDARRNERGGNERGSVIVEAAIIVPLLVMLTFGCLEFGLAFRDSASVSASTRSGARIAAAMPGVDCSTSPCTTYDGFWDAARTGVNLALKDVTHGVPLKLSIFKANPTTGDPVSGAGTYLTCTQCYVYSWNAASKSFAPASSFASPWTAASQKTDVCAGTVDAIGVYVQVKQTFLTGLFGASKTYDHATVMRLEPAGSDLC